MSRWRKRPAGSNWGEFGEDDQIGRMNLVTPERRRAALREAREGVVFTLSLPLDYPGGSSLFQHRKPPRLFAEPRGSGHNYNFAFEELSPAYTDIVCDDAVLMYTQYSTQWDALGHVGSKFDADEDGVSEKVYYNGYHAGEHMVGPGEPGGPMARALGIENLAMAGVQGRGTLIDLHAIHGRERALVGYDLMMRALDRRKASVEPGDFLCLYTGFADLILEMNKSPDAAVLARSCAVLDGRDERLLQWITDSELAAICADNYAVEALPSIPGSGPRYAAMPLHEHCLFKLGVCLGELWYFRELASWLAAHARSHFLLTAPPLRLPGSVGSPVTPIATV